MSLAHLIELVSQGKYAGDLGELRLCELRQAAKTSLRVAPGESPPDAVMRVFRSFEDQWLSSGFFVRYLGLERWTAQKICAELAQVGQLERRGRTSGTRYRCVEYAQS